MYYCNKYSVICALCKSYYKIIHVFRTQSHHDAVQSTNKNTRELNKYINIIRKQLRKCTDPEEQERLKQKEQVLERKMNQLFLFLQEEINSNLD